MKVGEYHFRSFEPETGGVRQSTAVEIIFAIDESGSMVDDHEWFNSAFIDETNSRLRDHYQIGVSGVKNKFGLLVFASHDRVPHEHGYWLVQSSEAIEFDFVELYHNGKVEDGYMAIRMAAEYLNRSPQVSGVERIIVLVTDEDRDNVMNRVNKTSLLAYLGASSIRLDVVVTNSFESDNGTAAIGVGPRIANYPAFILRHGDDPLPVGGKSIDDSGHGSTLSDYIDLAWMLCGVAWDINEVKRHSPSDKDHFGRDFTKYFSKRIHDIQCGSPEPVVAAACRWCTCQSSPRLAEYCSSTDGISDGECRAGSFGYRQIAGIGKVQRAHSDILPIEGLLSDEPPSEEVLIQFATASPTVRQVEVSGTSFFFFDGAPTETKRKYTIH